MIPILIGKSFWLSILHAPKLLQFVLQNKNHLTNEGCKVLKYQMATSSIQIGPIIGINQTSQELQMLSCVTLKDKRGYQQDFM